MTDMTWISVAFAALATLTSVLSALIAAYVKVAQIRADAERDVLKARTVVLETQNATQAVQIAELKRQHEECEKQFREIRMAVGIASPTAPPFPGLS